MLKILKNIGSMFSGTHWNGSATEYTVDQTAKWDGSAWTAVNNMITGKSSAAGFGTQSAAMCATGSTAGTSAILTSTETYDGTSWSAGTSITTGRMLPGGGGTSTSAIIAGGLNSSNTPLATVELWNGTAWSAGNSFTTARYSACNPGIGSATSFITSGGDTFYGSGGTTANTQVYDSTTWTTGNDQIAARANAAGGGGTNTGIIAGGSQGGNYTPYITQTQLYEVVKIQLIGA